MLTRASDMYSGDAAINKHVRTCNGIFHLGQYEVPMVISIQISSEILNGTALRWCCCRNRMLCTTALILFRMRRPWKPLAYIVLVMYLVDMIDGANWQSTGCDTNSMYKHIATTYISKLKRQCR